MLLLKLFFAVKSHCHKSIDFINKLCYTDKAIRNKADFIE